MWKVIRVRKLYVRICKCGKKEKVRKELLHRTCTSCKNRENPRYNLKISMTHKKRLLSRIHGISDRCFTKSNKRYKDYGGRGITVYTEWVQNRLKFLQYLMTLSGWDNPRLTIDRIDNNGNYEPGNLRFATHKVQANNRRKRRKELAI